MCVFVFVFVFVFLCVQDAHEFITTILDQFGNIAPLLKQKAALLGKIYRCPIVDNFVFQIQNTRTCKV